MRLNDVIAKEYGMGNSITKYKDYWIFNHKRCVEVLGKNAFFEPSYDNAHVKSVARIHKQILEMVEDFVPMNVSIWDVLFPEWENVCIGSYNPEADQGFLSTDYITNLEAQTFHEGFAHLLSYEGMEIDTVEWKSEKLCTVWSKASQRMEEALAETEEEKRREEKEKFTGCLKR